MSFNLTFSNDLRSSFCSKKSHFRVFWSWREIEVCI